MIMKQSKIIEMYDVFAGEDIEDDDVKVGSIRFVGGSTAYTQGELKQQLINWLVERNYPSGYYYAGLRFGESIIYAVDSLYFNKRN